ncbi:hypothetical protein PR048_001948, partial [Dryococelus australis]
MKRHQQLSLRKLENMSLARATAFNKTNLEEFFGNYTSVMDQYHFPPNKIFNLDETGVSHVLPSPKIISETGKKLVGQVFVFPKIHLRDCYLTGAPTGCLGLPSSSGWMTADFFIKVLQHVQQQTNCSSDNPILLLLDNHSSYITVESVSFAKDHGITLLTIAPHCSHRMQPLDSSVFGPFKAALRPCRSSIHKLIHILSSFSRTGIWPLNRLIFSEEDFLCSYVSDRPLPNEATNEIHGNCPEEDPGAVAISLQISFENVVGNENHVVDVTVDGATTSHSAKDSIVGPLTPSTTNRVTQKKNGSETEESDGGMELLSENEDFDFSDSESSGPVPLIDSDQIEIENFLMVKFTDTKDNAVFYVGRMQVMGNKEYEAKYLRKKGKKFVFPDVDDISVVPRQDIFSKFPRPKEMRGTKQTANYLTFD